MDPEELVRRAQERCKAHSRSPVRSMCYECFDEEMTLMLMGENPEMCRGDAFELVQEWHRAVDETKH